MSIRVDTTTMSEVARKHHFIPEFFLANFTPSGTKDDFLCVTDRKERMGHSVRPRNAGFQKDFYRVHAANAPPDIVETMFAWFEGYVAPAVRYVLDNYSLPPRPKYDHLMELIGLLVIRVPAARERVDHALDQRMKNLFRPYFQSPSALRALFESAQVQNTQVVRDHDIDYEELARFAQKEDLYTLGVDQDWVLVEMLRASKPAQQMMFERNWSVLVAEDDAGDFICSDAPVCLTWTDRGRQDRGPRLDERTTDLTVPLGKRVALQGRYEPGQPGIVRCDRRTVGYVNIRTISSGERFIYSACKHFPWERDNGTVGDWHDLIADLEAIRRESHG